MLKRGFASVQQWYRAPDAPKKEMRNYAKQAIEEKESFKWLRAAQETKAKGAKTDPQSISLFATRAREVSEVPVGEEPILWSLASQGLTTQALESFIQARQLVFWYSLRWNIEQFFRTLKPKGLALEATELESIESLA